MYIGIVIILFVGAVILSNGIFSITYEKRFMKNDVSITKGTIVEICKKHKHRGAAIFYPRVEYFVNGTMITRAFIANQINEQKYHTGDKVDIAYRNDRNTDHIIVGNDGRKGAGIAAVIFGSIFIFAGFIILFAGLILG